ncbi:hypothetical protein [Labilibacter marinus]|uniref:hypothetical protein n=1 Tax=Labilibacter marinus TaxID=1477105 RepID=UPI000950318C|nr:hypothetical protein [Labilibacter marinus]
MRYKITYIIIGILFFNSCSAIGTLIGDRHQKKRIKLASITNQVKIGYETENAIIYVGKKDALKLTEKILSSNKYDPRFDKIIIEDLRLNLDSLKEVQEEIIFKHWLSKSSNFSLYDYNFAGYLDQWILQKLLLKGKAEVFNKEAKGFEQRIVFHFIKGSVGGEQCYYTFNNGIEFHRRIISL